MHSAEGSKNLKASLPRTPIFPKQRIAFPVPKWTALPLVNQSTERRHVRLSVLGFPDTPAPNPFPKGQTGWRKNGFPTGFATHEAGNLETP